MKRTLHTLSLMLLCLMTTTMAMAGDIVYDFTSGIPQPWSTSQNPLGAEATGELARGTQFTADATLTLQGVTDVTQVSIVCSSNVAGKNAIALSVGGQSWGTETMSKETNVTKTFTGTKASGNLVITISRSDKSVYIKQVIVTGNAPSGGNTGGGGQQGSDRLDPAYTYAEPTQIGISGATGNNMAYTFIQNNIQVSTSTGAQTDRYFGCNAGATITFTATQPIRGLVINGYIKKDFTATATAGQLTYTDASEQDTEATPVLVLTGINSTSVTIACDKQLRCYGVDFYFQADPDVEVANPSTGGGAGGDYSYEWEPTTKTTLDITFDQMQYADMTQDVGYGLTDLIFRADDYEMEAYAYTPSTPGTGIAPGTYPINATYAQGTVQASPGGDDYYDYPTYITTDFEWDEEYQTSFYNTCYYVVSGTLTVASDPQGVRMTIDGVTYNGSTVHVTYVGEAKEYTEDEEGGDEDEDDEEDEDALTYEWEPDEQKTITAVLEEAFSMDYSEMTGTTATELYLSAQNFELDIVVFAPGQPGTGIAPGTYTISDSCEPGTVMASQGGNYIYDMPTVLTTDYEYYEEYDEWFYNTCYYLHSGTLTVQAVPTGVSITLQGRSAKGSTITATYVGPITSVDGPTDSIRDTQSQTAPTVRKYIQNGQLMIQRDGRTYNAQGIQVK